MVFVTLLKDATSFLGIIFIITTTVKITSGYPIKRWFF